MKILDFVSEDWYLETIDENLKNSEALVNSGGFGHSFDPKYNKYNPPGTSAKDGQDGKKKGAMPGMVG